MFEVIWDVLDLAGIFQFFAGALLLTISLSLVALAVAVISYIFGGYTLLSVGRKAGLPKNKDWMPFVPFCRTVCYN